MTEPWLLSQSHDIIGQSAWFPHCNRPPFEFTFAGSHCIHSSCSSPCLELRISCISLWMDGDHMLAQPLQIKVTRLEFIVLGCISLSALRRRCRAGVRCVVWDDTSFNFCYEPRINKSPISRCKIQSQLISGSFNIYQERGSWVWISYI